VVADSERLLGPDHRETAANREALKTWRNAEE
jgi:hypothetical protein